MTQLQSYAGGGVASGNIVGRINEVTLRRSRLLPGWVTVFGGQTTSVFHQATQANSASYPQRHGKWVQPKCGDAVRLASKGRYGSFHLWITCGWQVKLCDPSITRANLSALAMSHDKALHKSTDTLLLLYLRTQIGYRSVIKQFAQFTMKVNRPIQYTNVKIVYFLLVEPDG